MYQREAAKAKKDQWEGWKLEILEWLERQNFKDIWEIHKQYYDKSFVSYFEMKLSNI